MDMAGIYRMKVERGEEPPMFYVGQAVSLGGRKAHHFRFLRNGKHKNTRLQRAFDKYGAGAFTFEILLICQRDKKILSLYEQAILDSHDPAALYNVNRECVNSRLGVHASSETRAKQSASLTGITRSLETRQRISTAKQGWEPSPEHLEHLRKLGQSDANRTRMAEVARGPARLAKIGKKKSLEEITRRQATRAANRAAAGIAAY